MTPETAEADQEVDQKEGAEDEPLGATELAEQLGRDVGALLQRELELNAARNSPALRRTARTVVVWTLAGVAFATAFALANWAAVQALDAVLAGWAAPLVLAAAWAVLGKRDAVGDPRPGDRHILSPEECTLSPTLQWCL